MRTKDNIMAVISGNNHTLIVYCTTYGKRVELYDSTNEDYRHRANIKARRKYVGDGEDSSLPQIIRDFKPYCGERGQQTVKLF